MVAWLLRNLVIDSPRGEASDIQWVFAMHGAGRTMRFDLASWSRSWPILRHYRYNELVEREKLLELVGEQLARGAK
jgi:hypothetical protein